MNYSKKGLNRCYKYRVAVETFENLYTNKFVGRMKEEKLHTERDPKDNEYMFLSWKLEPESELYFIYSPTSEPVVEIEAKWC